MLLTAALTASHVLPHTAADWYSTAS